MDEQALIRLILEVAKDHMAQGDYERFLRCCVSRQLLSNHVIETPLLSGRGTE